jgi:hypothetical protein
MTIFSFVLPKSDLKSAFPLHIIAKRVPMAATGAIRAKSVILSRKIKVPAHRKFI